MIAGHQPTPDQGIPRLRRCTWRTATLGRGELFAAATTIRVARMAEVTAQRTSPTRSLTAIAVHLFAGTFGTNHRGGIACDPYAVHVVGANVQQPGVGEIVPVFPKEGVLAHSRSF